MTQMKCRKGLFHGRLAFHLTPLFFAFLTFSTSSLVAQGSVKSVEKLWEQLDMDASHHTGLIIYDPQKDKTVFNYKDDNFFIPGSNVKILTMYGAIAYLDQTIPAAYYQITGDTMIVWGAGDPGTYYPDINMESALIDLLKSTDKKIVFSNDHFTTGRYGRGWAWDDHMFTYQAERNAFPIYGNRLWIERFGDSIVVVPDYAAILLNVEKGSETNATRNELGTQYTYQYNSRSGTAATIPMYLFENDIRFIWQEATGKQITFKDYPLNKKASFVAQTNRDTLLQLMMKDSDNFIAEQLLLACALDQIDSLDDEEIIKRTLKGPLSFITDSIVWIDGSGLSRYNLMSPRSTVAVLDKFLDLKGLDYVKEIFPAGGESGTLKNFFPGKNGSSYIFAKSGSLRNTFCLSGYLITSSGKVLIFSWMNNNYRKSSSDIRSSMEQLFIFLRDHYQ